MFEAILGMILLGGAVIAQMAEDDFDVNKMAERQMKEQDKRIQEASKKFDENMKNHK